MYLYCINYFITVNINWCNEKQADLMSVLVYNHAFGEEGDRFGFCRGVLTATGTAATVLYLL